MALRDMVKCFIPILILVLVGGACRKKRQPEAVGSNADTQPVAQAPAAPNQPQAPGPPSAPATGRTATPEDIAAYNRSLSAWINVHDDVPKDLEELKKRQGLPPLPKPPPGRQIVYVPRLDRPTWSAIRME